MVVLWEVELEYRTGVDGRANISIDVSGVERGMIARSKPGVLELALASVYLDHDFAPDDCLGITMRPKWESLG